MTLMGNVADDLEELGWDLDESLKWIWGEDLRRHLEEAKKVLAKRRQ